MADPARPRAGESFEELDGSGAADLRQLENRLLHLLANTHPLRMGTALRRAEAEALPRYPPDQVAAALRRAIDTTLERYETGW
ncbi:hypothetical protein ACFHW0_15530 [Micromonospora sp. LOL_025]|uniref:hypothetical protein n=1 Tax=Micromonospora sp. LOL_025 TaxID=3345413 RepID=UPI003A84FB25